MKHFESAALKLTAFYISLLMAVSLMCSFWLYNVASREVRVAWSSEHSSTIETIEDSQAQSAFLEANNRIQRDLLYFNLVVFGSGTLLSYLLARRTLQPIQKNYQLQEDFASNASHELRTPLTALKAELQLVRQDDAATIAHYRGAVDSSLEEVDRLIQVSTRLLRLSAPPSSSSTTDVGVAIKKALSQLRPLMTEKNIQVKTSTTAASVSMNEGDMVEVLAILLNNAVKFSPAGSSVTIDVKRQLRDIAIAITNNGPGISPEDIPHIFERFYRGKHTVPTEGHGLGLALAQKLIIETGGRIVVDSKPGLTRFTIILPA